VPSQIILQKYLNANDQDVTRAKEQLKNTLDWRAKNKPSELIQKKYSSDKFAGLGYVTSYPAEGATPDNKEVFTWNIYGGVKDIPKSFGDLDAFIEWRVALMEMAMKELDLSSATKPITANDDPYKIYQVHDYKGISFLRSPPSVRGAAKKTVEVLAMAYPETLREKFFINVPGKLDLSAATLVMLIYSSYHGLHVRCDEALRGTQNNQEIPPHEQWCRPRQRIWRQQSRRPRREAAQRVWRQGRRAEHNWEAAVA